IALEWMLGEARAANLLVDPAKVDLVLGRAGHAYAPPDPKGQMHESLKGFWWVAEYLPKRHYNWKTRKWEYRLNMGRRRTIPPGSVIHVSAFERGQAYAAALPPDAIRYDGVAANRPA